MKIQHITTLTLLARRFPMLSPRDISDLIRCENQLSILAVAQCNRELTEREESKIQRTRKLVADLLKPTGFKVLDFHRDPRGVSFVIDPEDRNGNHFGGGWTFCL